MRRAHRIGDVLWPLGALALAVAGWIGLEELARRVAFEFGGPFTADSPIYWAIGRGILNGLLPYRDLFETKPPGIFLLSSLSLQITGTHVLGAVAQGVVIAVFPALTVLAAARLLRSQTTFPALWFLLLVAMLFGTMVSMYVAERSGAFQVESFGAFFCLLYFLVLCWDESALRGRRMWLAAVFLAGATGMKEPFLFVACAGAVILRPQDLWRSFFLPAFLALTAGATVMLFWGVLLPYLLMDLHEVWTKSIVSDSEPLWWRMLRWDRIARDLHAFHPALLASIGWLALGCAFSGGQMRHPLRRIVIRGTRVLVALVLLAVAVAAGGQFFNHHYAFAAPGYIALFLGCLRSVPQAWVRPSTRIFAILLAALVAVGVARRPTIDYGAELAATVRDRAELQTDAQRIDAILDACHRGRYLFLGPNGAQVYGFTRHSPLGPLFFQYDYLLDASRPAFRSALLRQVDQASLVVLDRLELNTLTSDIERLLEEQFGSDPWSCADALPTPQRYRLLFRHSS